MRISVVGLGKIGLPLAVQYAKKGHDVVGVDVNEQIVEKVNVGVEPFPGEEHLATFLGEVTGRGNLVATSDYSAAIPSSDVVVVVVPLVVDNDGIPDFQILDSATSSLAQYLSPGTLVSYETTLPVGTTRNRFVPQIEQLSGLKESKDFFVVFSPERVLTGRVFKDLARYPKIVGGLSSAGTQRGVEFYEAVLDFEVREDLGRPNGVWAFSSVEAAELMKLAETTYRDVNIGLVNQFARFADKVGVNIYEVIEGANSQPYSHIHQPGIAVGGHCIPVYPRLYLWNDPEATVVEAARQANLEMPTYSVQVLEEQFGSMRGLDVLVLGASYRGGVKETAFSGVFDVVRELKNRGANAFVDDPLYSTEELQALGFETDYRDERIRAIIVQANHTEYVDLDFTRYANLDAVFDGRNFVAAPFENILVIGKG